MSVDLSFLFLEQAAMSATTAEPTTEETIAYGLKSSAR
jgi:hypothetical protein